MHNTVEERNRIIDTSTLAAGIGGMGAGMIITAGAAGPAIVLGATLTAGFFGAWAGRTLIRKTIDAALPKIATSEKKP